MIDQPSLEQLATLNVSRETIGLLENYVDLLTRWNASINLVSKNSLLDIWSRHIIDSVQLKTLIPTEVTSLADLGSGAGLPGIVLALCVGLKEVHLVESDKKKAAFLQAAAQIAPIKVIIHQKRVEKLHKLPVQVVVARALAPLGQLLDLCGNFTTKEGCLYVFPKGKTALEELEIAEQKYNLDYQIYPSITDPKARIFVIKSFSKK